MAKKTTSADTEEVKKTTTKAKKTVEKETEAISETKKAAPKAKKTKDLTALFSEIEKRSYELYLERQAAGQIGNDIDDWVRAETEIKAKYGI